MKQKIYLFFALLIFSGALVGQATLPTLPLDFESATADYTFTNFDGGSSTKIANPQINGINTSANVAQMIKSAGQPWGGSWIQLAAPMDFSVNKTFKVKVFSPRIGARLLLKVENATNGGISFEREATTTVANAWEELTFDYTLISTTEQYHKLVLIFDNGTMGDGSANFTWLFDDVRLIYVAPTLNPPVLPLTFESATTDYTFTNFDGGNTTKIANPQVSGINTTATVAQMVKNAGQPWGGSWIQLAGPIDFSTNKTFKVKVFSPRVGAKLLLKVENATNGGINFEKEVLTTMANTWEELTFDYSLINTANAYHKVVFIFDLGTQGDGSANFTWLFDDVRLIYVAPTLNPPVLPLTFESATTDYTFTNFDGGNTTKIANPQVSGINTTASVAQMVKNAGQPWGGSLIQLAGPIDFSVNKVFKVKVFSPRVGAKLSLKVENASNPGINFEKEATTTVANAWEELTFDYNMISTTDQFHKLIFIFDLGTMGDGTANFTWLFDDVKLVSQPMTAAPAPPSLTNPNLFSLYSDVFTPTAGLPVTINWNPSWGQSTVVSDLPITGNTTRKYENLNYQGVEFGTPIDVSSYNRLHLDIWTPNCTQFKVFLIDVRTPLPTIEQAVTLTPNNTGWNSFDIDLAMFRNIQVVDLTTVDQMKFEGTPAGSSLVYMDNLYFYNTTGLPITLTSFKATANRNVVDLAWKTQSESNNKGFYIEKSNDGLNFTSIGFVNGNGNRSTPSSYQFKDVQPSVGTSYYRLKQVDFNGTYEYSSIEAVKISKSKIAEISFYPNPAVSNLQVNVSEVFTNTAAVNIINSLGQVVMSKAVPKANGNMILNFDVAIINSGVYYLQLIDGKDRTVEKIVISKN